MLLLDLGVYSVEPSMGFGGVWGLVGGFASLPSFPDLVLCSHYNGDTIRCGVASIGKDDRPESPRTISRDKFPKIARKNRDLNI
jgi:hypothetical protein